MSRTERTCACELFLFLGLPGALLAALLTVLVAASGADRRPREQAHLRMRGASTPQKLRLESLEAVVVLVGGVAARIALAFVAGASTGRGFSLLESGLPSLLGGALAGFPWPARPC